MQIYASTWINIQIALTTTEFIIRFYSRIVFLNTYKFSS